MRAPPSLHDDQANTPCGDGAVSEIAERASTVRVKGAASDSLPNASSRPGGQLASVTSVVRGSRRRLCVERSPSGSVAVADNSRWEGYSWSGAVKAPDGPLKVSSPCVWHWPASSREQ